MLRYVFLCFLFMGWGFYELSGGSDFKPMSEMNTEELAALGRSPFPPRVEVTDLEPVRVAETIVQEPVEETETVVATRAVQTPATVTLATASSDDVAIVETVALSQFEEIEEVVKDIRAVDANRVNMRAGPGTNFGVLAKLTRGTEAEILEENDDGWVRLRVTDSGQVGWMAARLLSEKIS